MVGLNLLATWPPKQAQALWVHRSRVTQCFRIRVYVHKCHLRACLHADPFQYFLVKNLSFFHNFFFRKVKFHILKKNSSLFVTYFYEFRIYESTNLFHKKCTSLKGAANCLFVKIKSTLHNKGWLIKKKDCIANLGQIS